MWCSEDIREAVEEIRKAFKDWLDSRHNGRQKRRGEVKSTDVRE